MNEMERTNRCDRDKKVPLRTKSKIYKNGPAVWERVLGCREKGGRDTDENRNENVEVDSWSE